MDDSFDDLREASCQNPDCAAFYDTKEYMVRVSRSFYEGYVYDSWKYLCPLCGQAAEFDNRFDQDELRR